MSTSPKPHSTKTKTAHTTSAVPTAEAATIPPEIASTPAPPDLATLAQMASNALQQIAALLPFYDPTPNELKAARASTRVPVAALGVAATILEQNRDRYPGFDVETTRDAADYVSTMTPVSNQMSALQLRLARSIFNRHGQGASETLAFYQTLKGLSRVANGKDALTQQKALAKAMVRTTKKKRATSVTGKELKTAAKGIKASKTAAAKNQQAAIVSADAQAATAMAKLASGQPAATPAPTSSTAAVTTPANQPASPATPANATTSTVS